jgi:hypothetical protein
MTPDALIAAIRAGAPGASLIGRLVRERMRMFEPMCALLRPEDVAEYLREVDDIWTVSSRVQGRVAETLEDELIDGLDFHTVSFLRRQAKFARSGEYGSTDAETVRHELYLQQDPMRRYLDGLLLTYVAWPNHYQLLQFYRKRYLTQGPQGTALEIGPGHGWLALQQIRSNPVADFKAIDLSPFSAAYCTRMLDAAGCDMRRCDIVCGDILAWDGTWAAEASRVTIAEIIEHVVAPEAVLEQARTLAVPGAIYFVSTCVNIEAVDHLYRFDTLDAVRSTLHAGGLRVDEELIMPLETGTTVNAFEYAAICRSR